MKRTKHQCKYCQRLISKSNLTKHEKACINKVNKPILSPEELLEKRRAIIKNARNKITKESRHKLSVSQKQRHLEGKYAEAHKKLRGKPGKPHTLESKEKISKKAKASGHRRLKKNTYKYQGIKLDSSWEFKLAIWLDEKSICWIRPNPLRYDDNRCYFPDFFLPEFNIFIDTKNDYLIKTDSEKIKKAAIQNSVEILILSKSDLINLGVLV